MRTHSQFGAADTICCGITTYVINPQWHSYCAIVPIL